ncbi:MAG: RsmD family RNA methyltransferase, partial [Candidatus Limnocylindria bacterium]
VERSAGALDALRRNLAATGFGERAEVLGRDVLAFLDRPDGPYDLVFCDPPFADTAVLEASLGHPRLAGALSREAIVVARALRKRVPALPASARVTRAKDIGEERLIFVEFAA